MSEGSPHGILRIFSNLTYLIISTKFGLISTYLDQIYAYFSLLWSKKRRLRIVYPVGSLRRDDFTILFLLNLYWKFKLFILSKRKENWKSVHYHSRPTWVGARWSHSLFHTQTSPFLSSLFIITFVCQCMISESKIYSTLNCLWNSVERVSFNNWPFLLTCRKAIIVILTFQINKGSLCWFLIALSFCFIDREIVCLNFSLSICESLITYILWSAFMKWP